MNYQIALEADLNTRQQRLRQAMQAMNIEACILTTSVNLFYMTGKIYDGYYYLPVDGRPVHFVKRPQEISLDNTIYIRKPEQISDELANMGKALPKTILLETDVIPFGECTRLLNTFRLREASNASFLLRKIRSIKSEFEIEQARICARQHEAVYKLIPTVYKPDMTDVELQIEVERLMRQHGSMGIFRSYGSNMDIHMGIILVGENAEAPSPFDYALGGAGVSPNLPIGASGKKIKTGNTIMVDMAGNYTPWMTDITRVFSAGKTLDIAYDAHQVSIEINNRMMDIAKPGTSCADLYNISIDIVKKHKLESYFMGTKQQAKFVGHGVGLEINEPPVFTPRSKELLEPNIIFAFEPKFVIPKVGAVGVENTYLVTEEGIEKLTLLEENIIEL